MKRTLVHLAATVAGETVPRPGDFWPAYREVDKQDARLAALQSPARGMTWDGDRWSWWEPLGRESFVVLLHSELHPSDFESWRDSYVAGSSPTLLSDSTL